MYMYIHEYETIFSKTSIYFFLFFLFSTCHLQLGFNEAITKSSAMFNMLLIVSPERKKSIDPYNFERTNYDVAPIKAGTLDELELEKKYADVALKFSLADEIRLTKRERGRLGITHTHKTGLTVLRKLYQQRPRDVDDLG